MVIDQKMEKAINTQINAEFYSAYLYLSMAASFESKNLSGFSHWMKLQAKEESEHAMKLYKYVYERGGTVTLDTIQKPIHKNTSALSIFEESYAHEQKITKLIDRLMDLAHALKDNATQTFLIWFVNEQVEEENNARTIVEQLKMVEGSKGALLQLDHVMSKRE